MTPMQIGLTLFAAVNLIFAVLNAIRGEPVWVAIYGFFAVVWAFTAGREVAA